MLVGDCMTREVATLPLEATVAEGLRLMNEHGIHRVPVVDSARELLGIVSDMDLRIAEAAGRLADPISAVMTRCVVTVGEYVPLEEAASVMRKKAIGGLPVVRGNKIVGIITDGDIFDVFAHLLGVGEPGVRLTLNCPDDPRLILDLLHEIDDQGGQLVACGTMRRNGGRVFVLKIAGLDEEQLYHAVAMVGVEVADVLTEA